MPLEYNYGGILQAYALQTVLERMGHEVYIIRKSELLNLPKFGKVTYIFRIIKKLLLRPFGIHVNVFKEKKHNHDFPIFTKNTWNFVTTYIHSYIMPKYFQIPEGVFDLVVVGSDQVWRPIYFRKCYNVPISGMFLDYTKGWNIKRIAYAASFGVDEWEYTKKETSKCSKAAELFSAISVREQSGISLCKTYLGVDAKWVMDPTLLLTQSDYLNIINNGKALKSSKKITSYILDPSGEKSQLLSEIAHRYNNYPVNGMEIQNEKEVKPLLSVENWLNSFYSSELVFTDSFHGCVFSIIFNIPFFVYVNKQRGCARFSSLLKTFKLEDRQISNVGELNKVFEKQIDWNEVNKLKTLYREQSMTFLRDALK